MANLNTNPYALISVSDKSGIVELAKKLVLLGYKIISTGGTALELKNSEIPVIDVSDITGIPEMLDGRVKTLNNHIYGGILAKRDGTHDSDIARYDIKMIDIVVVNLYPFVSVAGDINTTELKAIENIDIGGVSLLRASAKNFYHVWSVSNPTQYDRLIMGLGFKMDRHEECSLEMRREFAIESFQAISNYDKIISNYLASGNLVSGNLVSGNATSDIVPGDDMPDILELKYKKVQGMRYGENPHQKAAMYELISDSNGFGGGSGSDNHLDGIINATQLQGKELSYNNIMDADSAMKCAGYISFNFPNNIICVIVKHNNPCGVAAGATYLEAYEKAFQTDPTSAFGGIIAFAGPWNSESGIFTEDIARKILANQFVEVIVSKKFSSEALEVLKQNKNVRVLEGYIYYDYTMNNSSSSNQVMEIKSISGNGILYQTRDNESIYDADINYRTVVKSNKKPNDEEEDEMIFAWCVAKHIKSNAIVFTRDHMTIGIGAGQMSRIDSTRLAIMKAKNAGLSLDGCVAASDAFFPFRDGVDAILDCGIKCIIQPGGSIRDKDIINAVNERDGIMVMTGIRHFLH